MNWKTRDIYCFLANNFPFLERSFRSKIINTYSLNTVLLESKNTKKEYYTYVSYELLIKEGKKLIMTQFSK